MSICPVIPALSHQVPRRSSAINLFIIFGIAVALASWTGGFPSSRVLSAVGLQRSLGPADLHNPKRAERSVVEFRASAHIQPGATAALPSGFFETQINGLSNPTAMALAPDGRIFVCQQAGDLRVIKSGALLATPFLTVTVNSSGERGLLGVAFDPNFASNQFVYVYYTATTPAIHNRVSRFTANGDVVVPGSELVILDLNNLSSATNHNGGAIHFGPDGKLYVAVGENANSANAQSFANLLGKMLRINTDPLDLIPSDNPYFNDPAVTGVNKAIWALGLRNPFTFSFQPGTGRMFINDVGENAWEEINLGVGHSNYGWPLCEGNSCGTPPADYRGPLYVYNHTTGTPTGCAIVGSAFYNPATLQFPAGYLGKYFFADLCSGFIRYVDPNAGPPIPSSTGFATGISSPVDLQVGNDGSLYYLARGSSSVFRIQYSGPSTLAINDVSVTEGNAGTTAANFTVTLSPASSQAVTVQFATADGTANAGSDYVAGGGIVTFAPGQTSQPVSITVNGDTTFEPNETFSTFLSGATNATIDDNQGVATIVNDDVCYSINPTSQFFPIAGGPATVTVVTAALCSWTAVPNNSWIIITSGDSGTGNGAVDFEVRENFTGAARQGNIIIGGQTLLIVQDAGLGADCVYAINPRQQTFTANGGSGNIDILADARCAWQGVSSAPWITITSGSAGIGNGAVSFSVAPNSTGQGRNGTITIGGQVFHVKQKP